MKKNILFLLLLQTVSIYTSDTIPKKEWNVQVGSSLYYELFPELVRQTHTRKKLANLHNKKKVTHVPKEKWDVPVGSRLYCELFPELPTGLIATRVVDVYQVGRKTYAKIRWESKYPFLIKDWIEQVRAAKS